MLTKRELKLPMFDREFLREPKGLIYAGLELAAEDLIYFIRHPKMKDQKKLIKDAIERVEDFIGQTQELECAIEKAKLKVARKILREKNGNNR